LALSAAALTGMLAQEASAGLAVTTLLPLKLAACRLGAQSTTAALLADSVIATLFWTKVKWIALSLAAVLTLGVSVPVGVHLMRSEPAAANGGATNPVQDAVLVPATLASRVLIGPGGQPIEDGNFCPADAVALAPDGRTVASARCDGTVKLWDGVAGGKPKVICTGHTLRARALAFSPDGSRLVSGAWDRTVRLWDTASGKELRTFGTHDSWVWAVAFAPDGKTVASAGYDKKVKLWDVETGACRATLNGHTDWVQALSFSRDSKTLASGSKDGTIRLWDVANRRQWAMIREGNDVLGVALAPDGETVASVSAGAIGLWDIGTGKDRWHLAKTGMMAVAFSPDGKSVAATGGGTPFGIFRAGAATVLLDAATGNIETEFKQLGCYGWSVAFAPNGKTLVVGEWGRVVFLNPERNKQLASKP